MALPRASVLITDLDNTLYDWVEMWGATFTTLLQGIVARSGIPQVELEPEIRRVHQKYGTSEYAFLIEELPSLRGRHPGQDLAVLYRDLIDAASRARRAALHLYPGVLPTLKTLKRHGCLLVAHTESRAFYTSRRIQHFGLDGVIDVIYSPPDHPVPDSIEAMRRHPPEYYQLKHTSERHLREAEAKPDPQVLLDIVAGVGSRVEDCVYVGDNLMKDIAMAQAAGVRDVHAAYGAAHNREVYELLRRVSHWPDQTVRTDREVHEQGSVVPSYVLRESFSELADLFEFVRWHNPEDGGQAS